TKPFEISELIARINALLKRTKRQSEVYKFKNITLNVDTNEVIVDDEVKELTRLEFCLLLEFIKNKNTLLNRDTLINEVWHNDEANEKTVNIAVKRLRQKLGAAGDFIKSVRGEGYKLC
ncbi:DNA-binding response regulator, partial [Campylobacter hyointestinalis subsp. lawsonii]